MRMRMRQWGRTRQRGRMRQPMRLLAAANAAKHAKGDSDRSRSRPRLAQPRCINFHIVARALSAQSAGSSTASSLTYPSAAAASSHTRVSPADP